MARAQRWFGIGLGIALLTGCVGAPAPAPVGVVQPGPTVSEPSPTATPAVPAAPAQPVATPVPTPTPVPVTATSPRNLLAVWDTTYLRVKLTWTAGCTGSSPCIYQIFRKQGSGVVPSAGDRPFAEVRGLTEYYDNVQRGEYYNYWIKDKDGSGFTSSASVSVPAF